MANSMTKFRVKAPLDLPVGTEFESHEKKAVHFDSGSEDRPASSMLSQGMFDDALVNSMAAGTKCSCKSTVLIVDDNEFNILPLNMLLQANHNIFSDKANNGEEAVKLFRRNRNKKCCDVRYRLILMDLVMPVLDGIGATIQIMDCLRNERAIAGIIDHSRI